MLAAVIFDFGGVFTASPFEAFARYEREKNLPQGIIRKINAANPDRNAWARFERAELDLEAFDTAFTEEAQALGHSIPGRELIPILAGAVRPQMVEALRRLKTKFKTGCITNNVPGGILRPTESGGQIRVDEVMGLFDTVIESSKLGIRKPDPRIYEMMCERLGVSPSQCLYLDDLGINLKPARALGMVTIKVESGPQAIAALELATNMKLA